MTLAKKKTAKSKPAKPRKDFPLFPHTCGQWAKKVRGKMFYFGTWDDPAAAEADGEKKKQAILDGRNPNAAAVGDTVKWLCDTFMDSKQMQHERGELSKRALNDYHRVVKQVAAYFGKNRRLDTIRANEFEEYRHTLPSTWGPTTINNQLRLVRTLFKYCNDIEAVEKPIRYAIGLKAVSKKVARVHASKLPAKEFSMPDVHRLLAEASVPMRAFIFLGLNCGYGTADIARLKRSDIDWEKQWLGEIRGKTGIARGAWLWPETIAAVLAAVEACPPPRHERFEGLAFLTRNGQPWAEDGGKSTPLTRQFHRLKEAVGIDRKGVGHYSLRHTFETVAGDAKDQPAVDFVMGHIDQSMAATYREGIDPARIRAVCEHVRVQFLNASPTTLVDVVKMAVSSESEIPKREPQGDEVAA